MSARKVPVRANSRLDHQAGAPLPRPQAAAPAAESAVAPALPRVTWLADMMTPDKNSFGVMRLLLALAVLVSHSIYLTTGQGQLEPLYPWTNYTLGQHGVQVFFILSGILVAQSLFASGSLRDFATARALRVFPALIICVLVTAMIMGPLVSTLPPVDYLKHNGVAAYIAKTVSLWSGSAQLPGVFAAHTVPGAVNTSVWTLKYEVLCYAILGVAGFAVMKMGRWREAAFALLAAWALMVAVKPVGLELHGGAKTTFEVLRYFMTFFGMGVLFYALRQWIPVHGIMLVPLGAMFAVAIGGRFQELAAAVFLGYLAIWLATFRFGGLRDFTNGNDYSYATYLYHMPVSQVLLHIWPDMHVVPLILATAGIVLWLAFFSWELVERPSLALRHRIWSTMPHSAEAAFDAAMAKAKGASTANVVAKADAVAGAPTAGPLPITPDKLIAAAAVASARASERLVREMAAKSRVDDDAAVATPTAAPIEVAPARNMAVDAVSADKAEPGAAQVWRPMPAPKKLRILDEPGESETPVAQPAAVAKRRQATPAPVSAAGTDQNAAPTPPRASAPLNLLRRATGNLGKQDVEPIVEVPPASVPKSRIAFATKRPATVEAPPVTPKLEQVPAEPSRAVVLVDDDSVEPAAATRVSGPRPTWTRPLGQGRPQLA